MANLTDKSQRTVVLSERAAKFLDWYKDKNNADETPTDIVDDIFQDYDATVWWLCGDEESC